MTDPGATELGSTNPLAIELVRGLAVRGDTLATAESLTGGLIGAVITEVPGASVVYRGGVISYATDLKATLAGVSVATLTAHGPVAASTAREMATGVAAACGSRFGLAVTGVAGPEPQDGHPVGQVFVALADRQTGEVAVAEHRLGGDRQQIRRDTAELALRMIAARLAN